MSNLKNIGLLLILLTQTFVWSQDNVFIGRDFWKTNPTINQVEEKIKEGNSPSQLNKYGFDAVVYALLQSADTDVIKHLLTKKGNDVNKLTHDGRTYIFWAAYKNNMPIVKHLLANGAKTDVIDDKGFSLFNFTAVAGVTNIKLYDLLISKGANPAKEKTPYGANALLLIAPNLKDFSMIDYFTKKGLSINDVDNNGDGIFNYVAEKDNRPMLEILIKKGLPYKNLNKIGGNAMQFATQGSRKGYNSLAYYKYLENLGINPNNTDKKGNTPLLNIAYGNTDIASFNYFINKGINVNQANKDGDTPLLYATYKNNLEIIKLLASKTKNINHTNNEGHTALTNALRNKIEVIDFLIKKGANTNIIDKKGNDLTYHLFKNFPKKDNADFLKKLNLLQEKGLVITNPQKNGNTLYHLAVEKQNITLLKFIKNLKIDINSKNKNGYTALQLAVMKAKNNTIIKHLITEGANKNVKTDFDESLYDLANENEALKNIDISFLK
ncbi:MAG: ankyrin repeat domain-containing protein [Tenacibaculum sp.]